MYEQFYGFTEAPFSLTPNTRYYFAYPDHQEALNLLLLALEMGEGFIKITGEVGTGKTLVCRKLLNTLAHNGAVTAYVPNPLLTPQQLQNAVADELCITRGAGADFQSVQRLLSERLIKYKAQGKRVVLLIDEAQTIPLASLEAIRLLTNLETEKSKLLQVVLFGQPELDRHLDHSSVRQIKQRITFSYRIRAMDRAGTHAYLGYRLAMAGSDQLPPFNRRALNTIHKASRGIPRLINILAHKSLLCGYGEGARTITHKQVLSAVRDTEDADQPVNWVKWSWIGVAGLSLSTAATAGVYLLLGSVI